MDLDRLIQDEMDRNHIAGAAACLIKDGTVSWSGGYGWANIAQQVPMTPDVVINIASVTKTITATALMQLWERGLFQLDDDINQSSKFPIRNPNHPEVPITFRQLLTHTSSLNDSPAYRDSYTCGDPQVSLSDWLTEYLTPGGTYYSANENFWSYAPGMSGNYSNVGFGVVGYLVEVLSQMPFPEYCRQNIFTPLGMDNTAFYLSDLKEKTHATPYQYGEPANPNLQRERQGVFTALCLYSFPNLPDGLARTSANDLARFAIASMSGTWDKPAILQPATFEKMMSVEIDNAFGAPIAQGLGWYAIKQNGQLTWGHGGADPGVRTQVYLDRVEKMGLVLLTNSEGSIEGITRHLANALSKLG